MTRGTIHLVPHTHWDREWYLSRAAFEARMIPMIEQLLSLLESAPGLRFHFDGQTILIEDYLAAVPADRPRIAALVSAGRLTLGPWYVLADELIPAGESLVRNLLIGRAQLEGLGGRATTWYSADAFGHPSAGPTIAGQFGIERAVLWRGVADRGDLVRWTDRAGRGLLTYHFPADGYEFGSSLVGPPERLADVWRELRPRLLARARSAEIAVFVGADHHAADPRLADLAVRLGAIEPELAVRVSSLDEYLDAVAAAEPALEAVTGEQRASPGHTWSLQGVHGTRSRLRRRHGVAEMELIRLADPLVALSGSGRSTLAVAWRRLVQSQLHDTLAGTTADSVAAEQAVRLEGVSAATDQLIRDGLTRLVGHDPDRARERPEATAPTMVLFNPAVRVRSGVVIAPVTAFVADVLVGPPGNRTPRRGPGFEPFHLVGPDGKPIGLQILRRERAIERIDAPRHYPDADLVDRTWVAFAASDLPGLGVRCLSARPGAEGAGTKTSVRRDGHGLSNQSVAVRFDLRSGLTLVDLTRDQTYRRQAAIESEPDQGDCYTPAVPADSETPALVERIEPLADGPLVGAMAAHWVGTGPATAVTGRCAVSVHADSPVVRLRIDLVNRASDHRLRVRFPIGVRGPAVAGAAFGVESRPPGRVDRSWPDETGLPTDPAHRFVAVAAGDRGMAVLAPGFFEYQWTEAGDLVVTLLRSVGQLSRDDLPTRRGHAGWPTPTPGAQEPDHHTLELVLVPIDESTLGDPARLHRLWEDTFLPPVALWLRDGMADPSAAGAPGLGPVDRTATLSGAGLVVEAIKPAERGAGVVVRAVNLSDRPTEGRWRFERPIRTAARIRADETVLGPALVDSDGRGLTFPAGPGDLVSFLITGPLDSVGD